MLMRSISGRCCALLFLAVAGNLHMCGAFANEDDARTQSLKSKHNWISTLTTKIDMDDKLLSYGQYCSDAPMNPNHRWGFNTIKSCKAQCQKTKGCRYYTSVPDVPQGGDCLMYQKCKIKKPYICGGCHASLYKRGATSGKALPKILQSKKVKHKGKLVPSARAPPSAVNQQTKNRHAKTAQEQQILRDSKIIVFVFYGRHKNLKILDSYLYRNLRGRGGIVDHVVWTIHKATHKDKSELRKLLRRRPTCSAANHRGCYSLIDAPPHVSGHLDFWQAWKQVLDTFGNKPQYKDALWLKIDDDIVFIRDGSIEAMALAKRLRSKQCSVLSANIVNHSVLASIHQRIGAYTAGYAPPNWRRNDSDLFRYSYEYDPWGACSLKSFKCAKNTHLNFLHNVHQDTDVQMYRGWHVWDFHQDLKWTRYSINVVMLSTQEFKDWLHYAEIAKFGGCQRKQFNDELCLSSEWPKKTGRHQCAISDAVMTHFTYQYQHRPEMIKDGVLEKYAELSELMKSLYR